MLTLDLLKNGSLILRDDSDVADGDHPVLVPPYEAHPYNRRGENE